MIVSEEEEGAHGWSVAGQEGMVGRKSESWAAGQLTPSLCRAKGKESEFYPVHNERF